MFYSGVTPATKRRTLRERLASTSPLILPGAFNAVSAQLIERKGFEGVYVSGHMIAADLGLPDIGLTTITEVAHRSQQIARMVDLPVIVDADTGFGEPMNVGRSIQALEDAGLAGCHIEDQINPKRCGHSEGLAVVDPQTAVRRIRAAVSARRDENFVIIARTDARGVEGMEAAIERAKMYVDAGADVIFAEALRKPSEFELFRSAIDLPLMVNLNEFGANKPLSKRGLVDLGINVAIYPMTLMRLALGAVEKGLDDIVAHGSQEQSIDRMQTKDDLYALLGYEGYSAFDDKVFTGPPRD